MPAPNATPLNGLARSVLIGGGAAGLLSIFPGLNLLNLFFMAWIVAGAALTIRLLYQRNEELGRGDALLAGALSGLLAGALFGAMGAVTIAGLTQEKLDALVETAGAMAPFLADGPAAAFSSGHFKALMAISIGLFMLLAIAAGALSGLACRRLLRPAREKRGG